MSLVVGSGFSCCGAAPQNTDWDIWGPPILNSSACDRQQDGHICLKHLAGVLYSLGRVGIQNSDLAALGCASYNTTLFAPLKKQERRNQTTFLCFVIPLLDLGCAADPWLVERWCQTLATSCFFQRGSGVLPLSALSILIQEFSHCAARRSTEKHQKDFRDGPRLPDSFPLLSRERRLLSRKWRGSPGVAPFLFSFRQIAVLTCQR